MSQSFQNNSNPGVLTVEGQFLSMYVGALTNLQSIWMNKESGFDKNAFYIQIRFLTCMIPDKATRNKIDEEYQSLVEKYQKTLENPDHAHIHAGLEVVTHMVEFLCQSFDLLHIDVTGPATSRQYRDAIIEIPDYISTETVMTEINGGEDAGST